MNITEHLRESDIFSGLSDQSLRELSARGEHLTLKSKEFLFNESFKGEYFYLLLEGNIRIFKTSYDGKESTIKIVGTGEIFAEAILFGKSHYPASAIATTFSRVFAIHRDSFWAMLENPESRNNFIESIFSKLRFLTDRIHYLSSYDVEDRFFKYLLDTYGKKYGYTIDIPKKDFAAAIGTIPETFSRLVQRLIKRGDIEWDGKKLTVRKGFWEDTILDE